MDIETIKNVKSVHHHNTTNKKQFLAAKSELADFNTENRAGKLGSAVSSSRVSNKSAMVCRICLDYENPTYA